MKVEKTNFGNIGSDQVFLYELSNDNGVVVKISNYGAIITAILTPDNQGNSREITCGFENIDGYFSEEYKNNAPYFGGTVGRCASRIHEGKFTLEGKEYSLVGNDRGNHLHGGTQGFDRKIWTVEGYDNLKDEVSVIMSLQSRDMEEGYPGNVNVNVRFTLTNENELIISYKANTDKATPISLTNHSYFNLSGFEETVHNHKVTIHSDAFLEGDYKGVAQGGVIEVSGRPEDFRNGKFFKEALDHMETGFDHYFLFSKDFELRKVASFEHAKTGRIMEVSTTEPGMLFYSGYFTSDALKRETGDQYGRYKAFCCETHRYPNGVNLEDAPKTITYPEEPFTSTTIFKFSTIE
ncbi:aldose epimerase family protein [Aquimarina litoralis]|uniref:aldose epimerase family protein n=1 Tax=Aquimarina litoralis TaxID=584605 RepID=UPI001C59445F|nr:aldose epimerase family protein [Aquimarina litoralis]MBW1296223.1 galactose-1-epimerase [Aquimarina litoralis]